MNHHWPGRLAPQSVDAVKANVLCYYIGRVAYNLDKVAVDESMWKMDGCCIIDEMLIALDLPIIQEGWYCFISVEENNPLLSTLCIVKDSAITSVTNK